MISLVLLITLHPTFPLVQGQSETVSSVSNKANNGDAIYARLGDPFYTENTKSTNTKVIDIDPTPKVEVTYNGNSTIGEMSTQTIGTILDTMNPDGSISSEGKAIILTASGQIITYKSKSIGYYNPDGSFSDSGIIIFNVPFKEISIDPATSPYNSTDSSYTQFDNLLGIYKKTVDAQGYGLTKVWKWR
jgi:hypothetical protein